MHLDDWLCLLVIICSDENGRKELVVLVDGEAWLPRHYFLGDEITFESIGLTLPVEEIYYRVHNEDMDEFLNSKIEQ